MADATINNNGLAASRHELVAAAGAGGRRPNRGGGGGHRGDRDRVDRAWMVRENAAGTILPLSRLPVFPGATAPTRAGSEIARATPGPPAAAATTTDQL
ncbi:hypothetical protein ETB97_003729 [Aspergillus alliaceus]|uniref:Uncharacterized protein n=1 Tax=Petromyces alliaceus TaxID=209559 RepID=A0A8H6EAJ4_PETAA|nr:hypothetical protein ETB97_003729 [Aspergillus burnettii]